MDTKKRLPCCQCVRSIWRRCFRQRPPEDDNDDLEMGGGTSLLVAERVREFSQTAGEAAPDARRQSVDVAVPSIASRVKSFERRSSTSVDAPLVRPVNDGLRRVRRRLRKIEGLLHELVEGGEGADDSGDAEDGE